MNGKSSIKTVCGLEINFIERNLTDVSNIKPKFNRVKYFDHFWFIKKLNRTKRNLSGNQSFTKFQLIRKNNNTIYD